MSRSLNMKRVLAILMSIAIAISFMPGMGLFAEKTKAAEGDWTIDRTTDEDFYDYCGTTVKLGFEVTQDAEKTLTYTYKWNDGSSGTLKPGQEISKNVKIDSTNYKEYFCTVTDSEGYSDTVYFDVDGYRSWYLDDPTGEQSDYSSVYLSSTETTATLTVAGKATPYDGAPKENLEIKYIWKKYDKEKGYQVVSTTTTPSYNVTGISDSEEWECEVTDKYGAYYDVYFSISKGKGWKANFLSYYYVNKGESPVLKAKLEFDEGYTEAGLGIQYRWSKWDKNKYEYVPVAGATNSLTVPAVTEYCEYKVEIVDNKNKTETVHFDVNIGSAKKVALFKIAYAIQDLNEPRNMTLADKAAVDAAKAAFDALSYSDKEKFKNRYSAQHAKLKEAVLRIAELQAEAQVGLLKYQAAVKTAKAKKVKKFSVKAKKGKKALAKWKATKGVAGYEVMYSMNKKFKKAKKVAVKGAKKKKVVIKKLKAKKKYFVKMRAYSMVKKPDGKFVKVYGKWTAKKTVKAKK